MIFRLAFQLSLLFLSASFFANGSDTIPVTAPPKINSIKNYTISEGLAENCLGNGFMDRAGRLWINPCKESAENILLSFFQFDGQKSLFYELRPEWLSDEEMTPVWYVLGETSSGFLFGANIENDMLFYWHPDLRKQYFLRLNENTSLLNIGEHPSGGILILSLEYDKTDELSTGIYRLLRLHEGKEEVVASLELDFTSDRNLQKPRNFEFPFAVRKNDAWFYHERDGIVKTNLNEGTMTYIPWADFNPDQPIEKADTDFSEFDFEWQMIRMPYDQLLLYLGHQNGFYNLDPSGKNLITNARLNRFFLKEEVEDEVLRVYLSQDYQNNTLIATGYLDRLIFTRPMSRRNALLIDSQGEWYDYTDILPKLSNSPRYDLKNEGSFFSQDFTSQVGSTVMWEGASFLNLRPAIETTKSIINPAYVVSNIISVDSATIIINSNEQVLKSNIYDGSRGRLTGSDFVKARQLSSLRIHNEKVWMSALFYLEKRKGLMWFDPVTNEVDHFPIDQSFDKFIFINDSEALFFTNGSDDFPLGEIYSFNIDSKTTRSFFGDGATNTINARVNDLLLQGDTILWIGAQNGLWQLDISDRKILHYNQYPLLQRKNILSIHQEKNGMLYLGTGSTGVLIFNPADGSSKQVDISQGLADNTVVGIMEDDRMNHWVATFDGITVLNSQDEFLFELTEADGLMDNRIYQQSFHRTSSGMMVFGSPDGLTILNPENFLNVLTEPKSITLYLTGMEYYDPKINGIHLIQGSYPFSEPIQIPADQRYLYLDFALSNYVNLNEHSFAYRLLPQNYSEEETASARWIDLGAESQVTISNLPAGDYLVQIRGSDEYSNQAIALLEIKIKVDEFFYFKWWFYVLAAMPFLIVAGVWIRRNITEKKRLRVEVERRTAQIQSDKATIEKQAEELQELDLAKSRFFTNISHEFRTPLTVILGLADQIKDQDRTKKLIRRNARLILNLINQILELRKLESGSVNTRLIQGNVVAYVKYLLESFQSLADDKGITLAFEGFHDDFNLDYDPDKLLHIVSNLLANALKFTPEDGQVKISLDIKEDSNPPFYLISVSDTGPGIPEEKITHIFDRFYQADDEISRTGSGTGIGLTLVRELVKLLQGDIHVESEVGKGTEFIVRLPLTTEAHLKEEMPGTIISEMLGAETVTPGEKQLTSGENSTLPRLLIVEDNADVVEYLIHCLEEDYQLFFASDGQEGMDVAFDKVPDVIISDVMMPRVNGFDLCNTLKNDIRTSHIPVMLLTAKADLDSRITGLKRGADAYLAKPFDPRELQAQLQNLLHVRQQLRERYASLDDPEPTEDDSLKLEDTFIIKARETILEHLGDDKFGVTELCRELAMSRTQLHNKIKSLTDRSTTHLIRMVRIRKAKQLLETSRLNVSQIAAEVGIYSLPYFSKVFSEETGLSPTEYRERFEHH